MEQVLLLKSKIRRLCAVLVLKARDVWVLYASRKVKNLDVSMRYEKTA